MTDFSTMANLAELDLRFSQPCKRCAQLLHGRVKFCPYCGGENEAPRWADEAANTAFGPAHALPDPAEPVASLAEELPAVQGYEATETIDRPIVAEVRDEAREERSLDIAHIVPAAFEWPDELPLAATTAEQPSVAPRRRPMLKYAAIGVGMVVSAFALVLGYVRSGQETDERRAEAPMAQAARVPIGPNLAAAASPAEPPRAAQAPAAATPPPVVPIAPAVPVEPVSAVPASAVPARETGKSACNEALAALALCPDAGAAR